MTNIYKKPMYTCIWLNTNVLIVAVRFLSYHRYFLKKHTIFVVSK